MTTKIYDASGDITSPIVGGFSITPHVSNNLTKVTRAIWVGGTGNLQLILDDETEVILKNVPVGLWPIRVKAVRSVSTTATEIIGLY